MARAEQAPSSNEDGQQNNSRDRAPASERTDKDVVKVGGLHLFVEDHDHDHDLTVETQQPAPQEPPAAPES